jgi:hypothetical protein
MMRSAVDFCGDALLTDSSARCLLPDKRKPDKSFFKFPITRPTRHKPPAVRISDEKKAIAAIFDGSPR